MKSLAVIAAEGTLSLNQLKELERLLLARGNFTREVIRRDMEWFCLDLGLDGYYFRHTPLPRIARHIESLRAARIISENSGGEPLNLQLISEEGASAAYMIRDDYRLVREIKRRIEENHPVFRLDSYRGRGYPLRFLNVTNPRFPKRRGGEEWTFRAAASRGFIRNSPPDTIVRYQALWEEFRRREVPLTRFSAREDTGETRVMIALSRAASSGFFTAVDFVFRRLGLQINREYVEPFADGTVIFSLYLPRLENRRKEELLRQEIAMAVCVPEGRLSEPFFDGTMSAAETAWTAAASAFAHQFLTTYTEEYITLARALKDQPELLGLLGVFKTHLAKDTYHEERIEATVLRYPEIVRDLFRVFSLRFRPDRRRRPWRPAAEAARRRIEAEVPVDIERHILEMFVVFSTSTLKTNFYLLEKNSIACRLDPGFLNAVDYPEAPYGIFFVLGKQFRGYHIRFRDIARGGIRILRSATKTDYDLNSDFIFDENYNLALTQQRKNKDIPEGGGKGTILPGPGQGARADEFFHYYIDGILDLILLPDPRIVDYLGAEELLFLGPDEGTAHLMDWAALHARRRGYRYWRSFTTGKSPQLGGVPHDTYGMTTHGVRQYVEDVISKLGWKEERLTKFQTGGPDGDLGSNEIKLSREKTLAVIDGSGVLFDPEGIDRAQLLKLAEARRPVSGFPRRRLSPRGFFVGADEREVLLPDGTRVANGTEFRNGFHFYPGLAVDIFVPCGGRPQAIRISNWRSFLDAEGRPRARVIVEGANLFITQEARLRLEEAGVILFKDASANKGGVTSSSLEVLASLALKDDEYEKLMSVRPGGKPPAFRVRYIEETIAHIRRKAHQEFNLLWNERERTGEPLSVLSDLLSDKINLVTDLVRESDLFRNRKLVGAMVERHVPGALLRRLGAPGIFRRVPEVYLRAFFAASLASDYVYARGLNSGEVDFLSFVEEVVRG